MGILLRSGINDLATIRPDLADQWHPSLNGELNPQTTYVGSSKRVWWKCESGHEWATAISNRSAKTGGTNCPYCSGRKVLIGLNDLATTNSELSLEWHPTKNQSLSPQQVSSGSEKKVWWLCANNHAWQAQIKARVRGNGCPSCAGNLAIQGETDLSTLNPELSEQWHPTRNKISPSEVKAGSGIPAWWICEEGHEWKAVINSRNLGRGCPYCANKKALAGYNDLSTTHPEIASEWDRLSNAKNIETVLAGSHYVAVWKCSAGHSWKAKVNDRQQGHGCPKCAGLIRWNERMKTMQDGPLSFLVQYPDLLSEWSSRNEIQPGGVYAKSGKKIWWVCAEGHEWSSTVANRANGSGCPSCSIPGFKPAFSGGIYLLESDMRGARKIGIANNPSKRLKSYSADWEKIYILEHPSGEVVRNVEAALLVWLRLDCGLPQFLHRDDMPHSGGATETFSMEGPSNVQVIQKIDELFEALSFH